METRPATRPPRLARASKRVFRSLRLLLCLLLSMAGSAWAQEVVYYHTDALGSVVAISDQNRVVLERREYEPYGQQVMPTTLANGPGYTGHVADAATGLVNMQQRYYDPLIARFLSRDEVTAYDKPLTNFNPYVYALNNPYRFTDPDGRDVACDGTNCHIHSRNAGEFLFVDMPRYAMIRMRTDAIDGFIGFLKLANTLANLTQKNESSESTSDSGTPKEPIPGAVDLVDDLAGQEAKGRIEAGEGKILPGMGDKKFDSETGTHDKVAISRDNADGTRTEVHADRNRTTGQTENVKIKQQGNSCRQASGCGE